MLIKRLRNLWKLSEHKLETLPTGDKVLKKDFPTISKRLATIVQDNPIDIFEEEQHEGNSN